MNTSRPDHYTTRDPRALGGQGFVSGLDLENVRKWVAAAPPTSSSSTLDPRPNTTPLISQAQSPSPWTNCRTVSGHSRRAGSTWHIVEGPTARTPTGRLNCFGRVAAARSGCWKDFRSGVRRATPSPKGSKRQLHGVNACGVMRRLPVWQIRRVGRNRSRSH